jgi:tetratricopeptide (TPR) repeat protein
MRGGATVRSGLAFWVALQLVGCANPAADHERLGDGAYERGQYPKALAEYLAAQRSGAKSRVWAKVGSAAIHAHDYTAAIDAYQRLAAEDPKRLDEACAGLEQVARVAERNGSTDLPFVAKAIMALRTVAPGRPLGRLAFSPGASAEVEQADALGIIPAVLATAPNPRTVDSLLLVYADAQRVTTACEAAARSYRTVLRRTDNPRFRNPARTGLAACAVQLGLDALAAQQAGDAEQWFETTLDIEADTPRGWRAQIGLGDARLMQGDVLGAAIAFQAVLSSAGVPDSLRTVATEKLNQLGAAPAAPETRQ